MKTSSKASPVENQSLREIQLNISKPFVDENFPKRIMIVDDDAYSAAFLTMEMEPVLEKFGLPVDLIDKCYSGESAV